MWTGVEPICLRGHTDRVWHASWSPSGEALATCSGDKTIRIWCEAPGSGWACVATLGGAASRTVRSCEWSPCGRYLAAAGFDATTVIWAQATTLGGLDDGSRDGDLDCAWSSLATLEGHENEVKCVAWNVSGTLLATCSRDKSVWVWEISDDAGPECVSVLHGHTHDVKFVVWHPSEDVLVSCSYDNTAKMWAEDDDDFNCITTLEGHSSTVWSGAFDATGRLLVTGSQDGSLIVWCASTNRSKSSGECRWRPISSFSGAHASTVYSVHWSIHSNNIVAASANNSFYIVNAPTVPAAGDSAAATEGAGVDDNVRSADGLDNLNGLRAGAKKPGACLCTLVHRQQYAHASEINCARWHPLDPGVVVTAGDDGLVKIWDPVRE